MTTRPCLYRCASPIGNSSSPCLSLCFYPCSLCSHWTYSACTGSTTPPGTIHYVTPTEQSEAWRFWRLSGTLECADACCSSPSLNHPGHILPTSRCHGNHRYCPPHHYRHPRLLLLRWLPPFLLTLMMTVRVIRDIFRCWRFFLVHLAGKKDDILSRMKPLLAASTAAATSECLWCFSSATPLFCFPLKCSAHDPPLLISCYIFLPPTLSNIKQPRA